MIETRLVKKEEIPALVDAGLEFFAESNYYGKLTPSPLNFAEFCGESIESKNSEVMGAFLGDRLAGFAIFNYHTYLTIEKISSFWLFFIRPDFRGFGFDRHLLDACLETAQKKGTKRFYFESGAGFLDGGKNDKLLRNLFAKRGFIPNGIGVMKGV